MKKGIFWKIYAVFFLLALIVIGAVWYLLYDFLTAYEAEQPVHTMESVLTMFTDCDVDAILSYTVADYSAGKADEAAQSVRERIAGKTITFSSKSGVSTSDAPVYSVRDDEGEICEVYLKASGERAAYDTTIWEIDRIENLIQALDPVRIVAPGDYIVKVNGEVLTDAARISAELPEELAALEEPDLIKEYTDFPEIVTYELDELYVEPEVTCFTPDESREVEPSVDAKERIYRFNAVYYETIADDIAEDLREFARKYVNYVTNDEKASAVLAYVLPGTLTYSRLEAVTKMNVWTPRHTAVQFSDMEICDYRTYSDSFFTCKLKFTYLIPYMMGDSEYETELTFYMLLVDGEWKIAEMLIE